jgi:hypothetical protein
MKGLILIDLPSMIEEDYFFRKGEIVDAGYHTEDGELSEEPTEYIWAEVPGWNPSSSLDFLSADQVEILAEIITEAGLLYPSPENTDSESAV